LDPEIPIDKMDGLFDGKSIYQWMMTGGTEILGEPPYLGAGKIGLPPVIIH